MSDKPLYNIATLFESLADAIGERDALVAGSVRHTFASLDARANQVANFLRSRGVTPGQHVGVHMYNSAEFIEVLIGVLKIRAVPVNVNYRFVADELRHMIVDGDLVAVFSQRSFRPELEKAMKGTTAVHTVVYVDDGEGPAIEGLEYGATIGAASAARDFPVRSNDDLFIVYTGGTTGMPKGVMWRHEDLFFAGLQGGRPGGDPIEKPEELAESTLEAGAGMNMLPAAPLIHGAAQFTCFICLFTGGKLVLQAGKSFVASKIWEMVRDEDVNSLVIVGDAMAIPLLEELEERSYDVPSLMTIASAGAVLSPAIKEKLQAKLESTLIMNNFGATEVGHQGAAIGDDPSTEGRPSFYMDETSNVLDEDGKPVEPGSGKIGRLARRGRIPLGYYKDPVKTAERFLTVDGVRWVIPGDMALVEADGRITVYGRGSNCINTGGEKVFPEEVEEALKSHPDVRDALVVGVPDPKWMQRVAAVVEPHPGKSPSLEDLQAHCRNHIAGYKVPRLLVLEPKVARFQTGKPDYTWAKERALAAESGTK